MDPLGGITAFPVFAAFPFAAFLIGAAQAMERVHQKRQGIIATFILVARLLLTAFFQSVAYKGTRNWLPLGVVRAREGITLQHIAAGVAVPALQHVGSRLLAVLVFWGTLKIFAEQRFAALSVRASLSWHTFRHPNVQLFTLHGSAAFVSRA